MVSAATRTIAYSAPHRHFHQAKARGSATPVNIKIQTTCLKSVVPVSRDSWYAPGDNGFRVFLDGVIQTSNIGSVPVRQRHHPFCRHTVVLILIKLSRTNLPRARCSQFRNESLSSRNSEAPVVDLTHLICGLLWSTTSVKSCLGNEHCVSNWVCVNN